MRNKFLKSEPEAPEHFPKTDSLALNPSFVLLFKCLESGEIVYMNSPLVTLLKSGKRKEPYNLFDFLSPEEKSLFIEAIKSDSKESYSIRFKAVTSATNIWNSINWIKLGYQPVAEEKPVAFLFMGILKSPSESPGNQLSQSTNFKVLSDYLTTIELWISEEGSLQYISSSCEYLTGWKPEDLAGDPAAFESRIADDDLNNWHRFLSGLKQGHSNTNLELRMRYPDGTLHWLLATGKKVMISRRPKGFRISLSDISQQKVTEELYNSALSQLEQIRIKSELESSAYQSVPESERPATGINSRAPGMKQVIEKINQVAPTDSPVLITGETGTGKELIANAIHRNSRRNDRPMIIVNCAALPPSLIESELFGREKGAYTGALARQVGRFELADKSTLLLDEIGDLPMEIQVKLLRVLQFGEFQMLGSPHSKTVDVRIIAATNRDLTQAIRMGTFRSDLFYRLSVFPIHVPPLRERKEDIPALVWSFIEEISGNIGRRIDKIPQSSMDMLLSYAWPGNVRELRNIIEYSIILSKGTTLDIVIPSMQQLKETYAATLKEAEKQHIESILNMTNGHIRGTHGAAKILDVKESTLRFRMKKLGIRIKR